MASDGSSGKIPDTSPVHGSQALSSIRQQAASGKVLPSAGKIAASRVDATITPAAGTVSAANIIPAPKVAPPPSSDTQAFTDRLNKVLNDSGLPDQFRLDPDGKLIQQVNPATGQVIGEFAVSEFPALARSVGVSGMLLDSLA
jgi:activator of HSP90 ATPase